MNNIEHHHYDLAKMPWDLKQSGCNKTGDKRNSNIYTYTSQSSNSFFVKEIAVESNYRFNKEPGVAFRARINRIRSSISKGRENVSKLYPSESEISSSDKTFLPFFEYMKNTSIQHFSCQTKFVAYFEQQLSQYTKTSNNQNDFDEASAVNEDKNDNLEVIPDKYLSIIQSLEGKPPIKLLEEAKTSSTISRALVKSLQSKDPEGITQLADVINSDIQDYVENENTCYLVKSLVKLSETTMDNVVGLAITGFDGMMKKVHKCRLVYTLCNHSQEFRNFLLNIFRSKMMKLLKSFSGTILLSLLICNCSDLPSLDFILDELKKNPEVIKIPLFSRAFATYMNKCSITTLSSIASMLSKNLSFLLLDNHGNYLLQIFYDRKCKEGIDMCNQAIKRNYRKVFVRRYCRYALLKAMHEEGGSQLAESLLELVTKDAYTLQNIILKGFSQELLLFCLAKVKPGQSQLSFVERLVYFKPTRKLTTDDNATLQKSLIQDIAIIWNHALSREIK